jgi:hypothetical protein
MHIILRRLGKEDNKFVVSLSYIMRPYLKKQGRAWLVLQIFNPSYMGGRDQEDHISRSAQAKINK